VGWLPSLAATPETVPYSPFGHLNMDSAARSLGRIAPDDERHTFITTGCCTGERTITRHLNNDRVWDPVKLFITANYCFRRVKMTRALSTKKLCEDYLNITFARSAQATLPLLGRFIHLLDKDIGNDNFCIKGYKRRDGIGFCIVKEDDQISETKVRTNFVVLKPNQRIIDFYHLGDPNNFAIIRSFNEISLLSDEELEYLIRSSFTGRAADRNLIVRW